MPAEVLFSIQKNNGTPFRTSGFRERWISKDSYRECWGATIVEIHPRFNLFYELPSPWGAFTISISPEGDGKSARWNIQVSWKKVDKLTSFQFVLEKYPESPEREYICIPSDPRKRLLRLDLSQWDGMTSFVYLL